MKAAGIIHETAVSFPDTAYFFGGRMVTRVAIIGIIVEKNDCVDQLNSLLHEYGTYIIGRMGLPYHSKGINIISIAIDAPQDIINTLGGKIGKIKGLSVKTVYSNQTYQTE